jgi:putative oxidoreductase
MKNFQSLSQGLFPFIGRILIALYFIPSGFGKLGSGFQGAVAYATSAGLPFPTLGVIAGIVIEIAIGIAFLLGFQTKLSALVLAVFTVVAAFFFHNYWAMPAEMQMIQSILFWNHLALVGGILAFMSFGAGRWSVDSLLRQPQWSAKAEYAGARTGSHA